MKARVVYVNMCGAFVSLTPTDWRTVVEAVCRGDDYTDHVLNLGRMLKRSPDRWLKQIHDLEQWDDIDWVNELGNLTTEKTK